MRAQVALRASLAAAMSVFIFTVWTLTLATFAPGCHGSARTDTIRATIVAVDSASAGFVTWNRETSKRILDEGQAKIPEIGVEAARADTVAKLDAHDKKVDDVMQLFLAAYRAGALAASKNDDRSLKDVVKAASALFDAIARVRGGK